MDSPDGVVFEIQVDKSLLEEVLNNNQSVKHNYEKVAKLEIEVKSLNDDKAQRDITIGDLNKENQELRRKVQALEATRRLDEKREQVIDLDNTESHLLTMKLEKMETERERMLSDFLRERKILEELLLDHSELKNVEKQLNRLTEDHDALKALYEKSERHVKALKREIFALEIAKLNLETQLEVSDEKIALLECKCRGADLEIVESKILKLKLQTVENDNRRLLNDFEKEITIMDEKNKPRMARVEQNVKLLKKWIETETRNRNPRDTENEKELKAQIRDLEQDKDNLIEGFEMERMIFRKILQKNDL